MKNYYALVAGLKEYTLEADNKGFDARAIIDEIRDDVSGRDRKELELFYAYYDIENIINLRAGRSQFSELGNFTREELEEELASPSRMPRWMADIIVAYNAVEKDNTDADVDDDIDLTVALERNLFAAYYGRCAKSHSKFLRRWTEFDRNLRNISAAFTARRLGAPAADALVGDGDIVGSLARSSAADFGLKGEVGYIDQIMAAVGDNSNLIEKEQKVDAIRWETADDLSSLDYFNLNFLLGYLVKVNIVHRWATLDPERGKEMLKKLLDSMTGSEILGELNEGAGVVSSGRE